jgi:hypothetical protein
LDVGQSVLSRKEVLLNRGACAHHGEREAG